MVVKSHRNSVLPEFPFLRREGQGEGELSAIHKPYAPVAFSEDQEQVFP
jgi:hypothetical protein